MSVETITPRTAEKNGERNALQRLLLQKCIDDGLLIKTDIGVMTVIFKLVSEIIDNPQEEHEAIRRAFESHDYDHAAEMLLAVVKEKIFNK